VKIRGRKGNPAQHDFFATSSVKILRGDEGEEVEKRVLCAIACHSPQRASADECPIEAESKVGAKTVRRIGWTLEIGQKRSVWGRGIVKDTLAV